MSTGTRRGILRAATVAVALLALPAAAHANTPRIVGGDVAGDGAYPAQAYVEITGLDGVFQCGGTLVSQTKVVTAAHCVDQAEVSSAPMTLAVLPTAVQVWLGSNVAGQGTQHAVSGVIIDPDYDSATAADDAAVLTLSDTATQPALPFADPATDAASYAVGQPARVIGWGDTTEGGSTSSDLREVDVPIVSDAECANDYTDFVADVQVCAGYPEGGKDSCQGDSGGPLMTQSAGLFKLVGIVSTGDGCAEPGKPGIYSELTAPSLRAWVLGQTGAPPTAQIDPIADTDVGTPTPVHVTASAATDIHWDLDEDGVFDDASGPDATWTPSAGGTHVVRALVTDGEGRRTAVEAGANVRAPEKSDTGTTATPAAPPVVTPPAVVPAATTPSTTTPVKPTTPAKKPAPITKKKKKKKKATLAISSRIVSGRLRVIGRVSNGTCRGAKVTLVVKRGGKRVAKRTVKLRSCRFTVHFALRGKLRVTANYSFSKSSNLRIRP